MKEVKYYKEAISSMTTKKELEAQIKKLEAKLDKVSSPKTKDVSIKLSKTSFVQVVGEYRKQISIMPFDKNGKYPTPRLSMQYNMPCTKEGLDEARALIDVAEERLSKAKLLTA